MSEGKGKEEEGEGERAAGQGGACGKLMIDQRSNSPLHSTTPTRHRQARGQGKSSRQDHGSIFLSLRG